MDGGSVLLHTCCGPCAAGCVPRLKEQGRRVALCFANDNLDTRAEYERRLAAARRLAEAEGVELVAEPYDHAAWLRSVAAGFEDAPEKGARCARCFAYSLAKTAARAKARGEAAFTTSLTVSPHKVSDTVFEAGARTAADSGVAFLPEDFKKREGFKRAGARAAELGLYRQTYCGCEFSRPPKNGRFRRIALTGGIACGKSLLTRFLNEEGIETLDADDIVHELIPADERRRLAKIVFADPAARKALEARIHPQVKSRLDAWQEAAPDGTVRVAVVPILFETGWDAAYDLIVCVTSARATQVARMMETRGYTAAEAEARLAAQTDIAEKSARSNFVIANDGTAEELRAAARALAATLRRCAPPVSGDGRRT